MTNKNPYENGVDIPDFVEKNDKDVDMSVFKMSDEEIKDSNVDEYDDEYNDEPRKKLSTKGVMLIGAVCIVVLLVVAIAGWIYGISKANAYTKLQAEYTTVNTSLQDANKEIVALKETNTALGEQIKAYQGAGTKPVEEAPNTKYKLAADISVRKVAGSKEYADFKKLPDEVADQLYNNDELKTLTTRDGAILPVYETKEVSGNTWGRIADEAWVCLVFEGETWGTKQ